MHLSKQFQAIALAVSLSLLLPVAGSAASFGNVMSGVKDLTGAAKDLNDIAQGNDSAPEQAAPAKEQKPKEQKPKAKTQATSKPQPAPKKEPAPSKKPAQEERMRGG